MLFFSVSRCAEALCQKTIQLLVSDMLVCGGRGLVSQSSDQHLLVSECTCTKQTAWIEDQFTVTSSAGIRNREKRVSDIVVRELKRAKPGVWGCIQAHEVWSSEEETNMWSGHFWISNSGRFLVA
jgi:hypothetical protein